MFAIKTVLPLALILSACAADPPPTVGEAEQNLCQRDPVTGRCRTGIDPDDAQSYTDEWIRGNVPETQGLSISVECSSVRNDKGAIIFMECTAYFDFGGAVHWAGCQVFVNGTTTCSTGTLLP